MQLARRGSRWSLGHVTRGSNFDAQGDRSVPASTRDIIDGRRSAMCVVGHIVTLITAIGSRRAPIKRA
jgi:hypothetical protein